MSRVVSYTDLVKQRVNWNKAIKCAKRFHGDEIIDFGQTTAIEYSKWMDDYRRAPGKSVLGETAKFLMQLEAIQYVLEERCAAK